VSLEELAKLRRELEASYKEQCLRLMNDNQRLREENAQLRTLLSDNKVALPNKRRPK
jgi:regulator of replication initiation timing